MIPEIKQRRMNLRSSASVGRSFLDLYDVDLNKATGVVLTTLQVARMIGVTRPTIRNYRLQRNLPYYTIEGQTNPTVRFDEGLVLDWLKFNHRLVINKDYLNY